MTDFPKEVPYKIRLISPLLRAPGVSYFSGKDISEFYQQYIKMCENYKIKNKIQRVTRYIDSQYADYMKTMEEYNTSDWETLKKILQKKFKKDDRAQIINIITYLKGLNKIVREARDV